MEDERTNRGMAPTGLPRPLSKCPDSAPRGGSDPAAPLVWSLNISQCELVLLLHVTVIFPHRMAPWGQPARVIGAQRQTQQPAPPGRTDVHKVSLAMHFCTLECF